MATSDLDTLIDMGFDRERAEFAVKQSGGLQGAIDWLDTNQEKSLEEIKAAASAQAPGSGNDELEAGAPPLKEGEEARSLVCNECGKRFRSHAQAEFHASKTDHVDFSESTEEIAPLTEEEKKAKLANLRDIAAAKRAAQSKEDLETTKRNELIRRKADKEAADAKDALARKEQLKFAAAQRQEKVDAEEAKKRIRAKIAADKEERRLKAEKEKVGRMGQTFPTGPLEESLPTVPSATSSSTSTSASAGRAHSSARLRLSHASGTTQLTVGSETTLFEVAHQLSTETGGAVDAASFTATFGARKTWTKSDFGMTVAEASWVPSAAIVVK